jgi:hypothetical protein
MHRLSRTSWSDHPPFSILVTEQRHLLAVFAQAGQREPKIGLVALPPKLELNEWLADQMGQPSANQRKDQSDPERQSGDGNFGSRIWVKGGCRRQVDGTAGLPSDPEMPCAPGSYAWCQRRKSRGRPPLAHIGRRARVTPAS